MFLAEKINIKIDIVNTVTEVKVVFSVFDIPLKLFPLRGFIHEKDIQSLIIGKSMLTINVSTRAINTIIRVFDTTALEMFPFIMFKVVISGTNAFIMLQRALKYEVTDLHKEIQILNTVSDSVKIEQMENALLIDSLEKASDSDVKIVEHIISTITPANILTTSSISANKKLSA